MTGTDKLPPLVIGKVNHPSALRKKGATLPQLKVNYYQNKKGWMTMAIFGLWLKTWNKKLARQRCNILLFVDNTPSHMIDTQVSNIKIVFIPPDTTSKLQPLYQGMIRGVKMFYCNAITK